MSIADTYLVHWDPRCLERKGNRGSICFFDLVISMLSECEKIQGAKMCQVQMGSNGSNYRQPVPQNHQETNEPVISYDWLIL